MKVDQQGHTTHIKDTQGDLKSFLEKVIDNYHSFKGQNIILDFTCHNNIQKSDLKAFNELLSQQKKHKKSLVIVSEGLDFNEVPEKYNVVPSILEACDLIEMDEIERDLGF